MDEAPVIHFLHFTGNDGIRDITAIGESSKPLIFEFDTYQSQEGPGNRTEVSSPQMLQTDLTTGLDQIKMNTQMVAHFDWHVNDKLGIATILGRQILMSHLCYNGDTKWVCPDRLSAMLIVFFQQPHVYIGRRYKVRVAKTIPSGSYSIRCIVFPSLSVLDADKSCRS